ncbi:MAG TPA: protein phosphatase 2C domain-containing protein [Gemmatimonadaceae bacterium]|jgi:protein phosphatase|nr:protein phosphatase 2C domain-containing protein [Gemmatimonadaceae bacterium]
MIMERRPRDDEIDAYGLTHVGKVRSQNQDHFLVGQLRGRLWVGISSLETQERLPVEEDRLASIMVVADGVGGGQKGEEASRVVVEEVAQYVQEIARCYFRSDEDEGDFMHALENGARRIHTDLRQRGDNDPATMGMATTLTMLIIVWPWTYLLQVGDSRYYRLSKGKLSQISRDQTVAQALVDQGILTPTLGQVSPLSNVLASSIGGPQTAPVVTRMRAEWENVHLLCSDGLTKHVSDEQIADRLRNMKSARQACEQLLQDALDGGGIDNITVLVGRALPKS